MKIKDLHQIFKSNFEINLCSLERNPANHNDECRASFGVIADVQYADHDDLIPRDRTWSRNRYYRKSLDQINKAVDFWTDNYSGKNFKFLIQLGDLLDGKARPNQDLLLEKTMTELNKINVVTNLDGSKPNLLHVWGNHEFYNFTRKKLAQSVLCSAKEFKTGGKQDNASSSDTNYYAYDVSEELRMIILDCFEISTIGYEEDNPLFLEAQEILRKENQNEVKNSPEGLDGNLKRFVNWNGGLSSKQFEWLESQLRECKRLGKKAIVAGHIGVVDLEYEKYLLWNYSEVLELLNSFSGTVIAYLSGHNHNGEYYFDQESGIHHITVPGIIETEPTKKAFATIEVVGDRIVFKYSSE